MPTIKRKVEMNLPQLIEYAWDNDIKNEIFIADKQLINIEFDDTGDVLIYGNGSIKTVKFSIEVEEEITEDTVIPRLVVRHRDTGFTLYENDYINNEFPLESVQAFYMLNDDLTMTLIWTNEKGMVE